MALDKLRNKYSMKIAAGGGNSPLEAKIRKGSAGNLGGGIWDAFVFWQGLYIYRALLKQNRIQSKQGQTRLSLPLLLGKAYAADRTISEIS